MNDLSLNSISISIIVEGSMVRVISKNKNILLKNQTIENVAGIIKANFDKVFNFYELKLKSTASVNFSLNDIDEISISIVLRYLYQYNLWNNIYKNKKDYLLNFHEDDFRNSETVDLIIGFYKFKYPKDWVLNCSILLEKPIPDLVHYYNEREKFYDK